jgi:AcrR family transcriptional regulator
MTQEDTNTEEKILEAAKNVFLKKGMAGSRMQEIADEANINKSLLHYYYRSKEKLFLAVFRFAVKQFIPGIRNIILSDQPIVKKIEMFVNTYIEMLFQHPFVPIFIIQEIQRDPDVLSGALMEAGVDPQEILQVFYDAIDRGEIRPINPLEIMLNMLSLCIFPFAAKPVMQRVFFDNNEEAYMQFLEKRKKTVTEFMIKAIKP